MTWRCKRVGFVILGPFRLCFLGAVLVVGTVRAAEPLPDVYRKGPNQSGVTFGTNRDPAPEFEKWLLGGINSLTDAPTSHFPNLEGPFTSVHDCNFAFAEWLLLGISSIKDDLDDLANESRLGGYSLQRFRSRLRLDIALLDEGSVVQSCVKNAMAMIDQPTRKRLEELLHHVTPQYAIVVSDNIMRSDKEYAYLTSSIDRIAVFRTLLGDLNEETLTWESFWKNTSALYGPDKAQRQLCEVVAKVADRWNSLTKREVAQYLLTRDRKDVGHFSSKVKHLFEETEKCLPVLVREIKVSPESLNPLVDDIDRTDMFLTVKTSCPGDVRVIMNQKGAKKITPNVTYAGNNTYRCKLKPDGITSREILGQMAQRPVVEFGTWQMEIEVWTTEIGSGYDMCSDLGKAKLTFTGYAPFGIKPSECPVRSGILAEYASEEDIPVEYHHNFWAFVYYPFLGFPRDIFDAAFGAIDKIPLASAPVSTAYAAFGQPIFKPWWSERYEPFSRQSAGYLSIDEMQHDKWIFFENSLVLKFDNSASDIGASLGYLVFGWPFDMVDVPFGVLDQIPYVGMPTSYAYEPVALLTKPWYAKRYERGQHKWERPIPYSQQSKNVVGVSDWWQESGWIFFENFKCTDFKSPDTESSDKVKRRYREALADYRRAVQQVNDHNRKVRDNCEIALKLQCE